MCQARMSAFLIQVSGHPIREKADPRYIAGAKGPRFCDEPLKHGEYFNASPFWQREGFGRHDAWRTIAPGDEVLLYCTGSVEEHGACLSHVLTVGDVSLDETEGARLTFTDTHELSPKLSYSEIHEEIQQGRLSEQMSYCGQEGFNITQTSEADVERVRDLTEQIEATDVSPSPHPDDSLRKIAEEYSTERERNETATLAHTDLLSADGTRIRRWERVPPDASEAVMFVHGATYGARSVFDPDGFSWLQRIAANGRAAFGVDVRGYGESERPPALDEPATENSPVVRARTAAHDVATAI